MYARLLRENNLTRSYVHFVLNFYIESLVVPCTKNVLRIFEAHFRKK